MQKDYSETEFNLFTKTISEQLRVVLAFIRRSEEVRSENERRSRLCSCAARRAEWKTTLPLQMWCNSSVCNQPRSQQPSEKISERKDAKKNRIITKLNIRNL